MANYTGTSGNDTFNGTPGRDLMTGSDGDDVLRGNAGFDTLWGDAGNDTLDGGDGDDELHGGLGMDVIDGGAGNDVAIIDRSDAVTGLAFGPLDTSTATGVTWANGTTVRNVEVVNLLTGLGDDTVTIDDLATQLIWSARGGRDVIVADLSTSTTRITTTFLDGGLGSSAYTIDDGNFRKKASDVYVVGAERIVLTGGTVSDKLHGLQGDDWISGAAGGDWIWGGTGNDTVDGAEGADELQGDDGNDRLIGGADNDWLGGGGGNDTLEGGLGDDMLVTGGGVNLIDGGEGRDYAFIDLSASTVAITADMRGADTATGTTLSDGTVIRNVENFNLLTGAGDDTITFGLTSSRWWTAGDGNDLIVADLSASTLSVDGRLADTYYDLSIYPGMVVSVHDAERIYLEGGTVRDRLEGLNGDDRIAGNGGNDTLRGWGGNDTLDGGDGDDVIEVGTGIDVIDGGAGLDSVTLNRSDASLGLTYDLDAAATSAGLTLADGTSIRNVESASLSTGSGDDALKTIRSLAVQFTWSAGAGNDLLVADFSTYTTGIEATVQVVGQPLYTIDEMYYGSVHTVMVYDAERIVLTGGSAADRLSGLAGDDRIDGGAGNDTLSGGTGNDSLAGGAGDDVLQADAGNDTLNGGDGNDVLNASGSGAVPDELDVLDGGAGDDRLDARADIVVIDGGTGMDWVSFDLSNTTEAVILDVADTTTGVTLSNGTVIRNVEKLGRVLTGSGNDRLTLGAGDDGLTWASGAGNDTLVLPAPHGRTEWGGGDGQDRLIVDFSGDEGGVAVSQSVDEYHRTWTATSYLGDFTISAYDIEAVILTGGMNDDRLSGLVGDDILNGGGGRDSLAGREGNDRLDGGDGGDTMVGGAGNDTYYVDNSGDQTNEADGQGTDIVYASVSYSVASSAIETLVLTGTGHIDATGNNGKNTLTGTSGNNVLDGRGGADTLIGGLGDDTYYVENVRDTIVETGGQGIDTVIALVSYALGVTHTENLTLGGHASINATGNRLDNVLTGNAGNNLIIGGLGADTMYGGAGNDTFQVDNTGDRVFEAAGQGTDVVEAWVSYWLNTDVENLILKGTGDIDGRGNALDNIITGTSGNNWLDGLGGHDRLTGGLGDDTYAYYDNGTQIVERPGEGVDTVRSYAYSYRLGANLENLTFFGRVGLGNELDNIIVGNDDRNFLSGEAGNDTLTGGAGIDNFIFAPGSGQDVITDFDTKYSPYYFSFDFDRIDVSAYSHGVAYGGGITVTQSGADTLVDLGGGNTVTLLNTVVAEVARLIVW